MNPIFKSITGIGIAVLLLSSCGSKLYSYRRTVKVKSEVAKAQPQPQAKVSETKVYITVKEVKTSKSNAQAELNVAENTIYRTTKPLREKAVATTVGIATPIYGASIR